MNEPELFNFIKLLHTFQRVTRQVKIKRRNEYENDMEHSYQLAMVVWYLAQRSKLPCNQELVLKYALAHDLVEIFAGDTVAFITSKKDQASKDKREKDAGEKLKKEVPDFPALHEIIEKYEKKEDIESKLVFIVDKILPITNEYLFGSTWYIKHGVSFKKWSGWLSEKMGSVDFQTVDINNFIEEIRSFFQSNHRGFLADEV